MLDRNSGIVRTKLYLRGLCRHPEFPWLWRFLLLANTSWVFLALTGLLVKHYLP